MQRWQMTVGLAGLALGAALLAPRLIATLQPQVPLEVPLEVPPPPPEPLPAAAPGPLIIDGGLTQTASLRGELSDRFLIIQVSAPADTGGEAVRRPVDLSVVIDASGSMSARGKIDNAKRAAKLLASSMGPMDTFSLVTFSDDATTIVPHTDASQIDSIHRAIDRILEGGGTNLYAGMSQGADQVRRSLAPGAVGRVVVLSDGQANVGIIDDEALARFAADQAAAGLSVSTIGLGLDYNEDLLSRISDVGGGRYDFVDDPLELEAVFADELSRTATVVSRNTVITVDLPPEIDPVAVLGWDATKTSTGWKVYLGDMYAGESRKIVAQIQVHGDRVGALPVANVTAAYHDVVNGVMAKTLLQMQGEITADPTKVASSVRRERAIEASKAWGSSYLEQSTKAYEQGQRSRSKELLKRGRAMLHSASIDLQEPELEAQAYDFDEADQIYQMVVPSSPEGKRAIKSNKERSRDLAR